MASWDLGMSGWRLAPPPRSWSSLAEAILALSAFFWVYWVAAQIGNVFACRTDRESAVAQGLFNFSRRFGSGS
jgi:hypothetical protein